MSYAGFIARRRCVWQSPSRWVARGRQGDSSPHTAVRKELGTHRCRRLPPVPAGCPPRARTAESSSNAGPGLSRSTGSPTSCSPMTRAPVETAGFSARLGPGRVEARVMLSAEPTMGRDGYPLLRQTGETADGVNPLVDRQHPHDLFYGWLRLRVAAWGSSRGGLGSFREGPHDPSRPGTDLRRDPQQLFAIHAFQASVTGPPWIALSVRQALNRRTGTTNPNRSIPRAGAPHTPGTLVRRDQHPTRHHRTPEPRRAPPAHCSGGANGGPLFHGTSIHLLLLLTSGPGPVPKRGKDRATPPRSARGPRDVQYRVTETQGV